MKLRKQMITLTLAALLLASLTSCAAPAPQSDTSGDAAPAATEKKTETAADSKDATAEGKPATWIADRSITVQVYVDDIGYSLPDDQASNPQLQELKKRTGIDMKLQYTPGDSDATVMATQLAAGTIPDAIVSYLNNSTRPEFPILYKAAKDGMFADLKPYFADSTTYKKYLEDGYLPNDSKRNIVFREDFGDKAYFVHLGIDRVDNSMTFRPEQYLVGGLYIQKKITDELKIDPKTIKTQDQFYDLLTKIKAGGFKDDNGNPVFPLGPKYWGGSADALEYPLRGFHWGVSGGYNIQDGKVLHEVQTDYAMQKVTYMRKLLAEGLVNPEFFTMDATRAEEVSKTHNSAIMADVHNYVPIIYESEDWVPLGPLNDWQGVDSTVRSGKGGYGMWAISADTKNPEEIFKLFDYLISYDGQILSQYGIEGVSYNLVDGKPRLTDEVAGWLSAGDNKSLINKIGAGFDGSGNVFFSFMMTDRAPMEDFGETRPGSSTSETFARAVTIAKEFPPTYRLVEGLEASSYLTDPSMADVKAQLDLLNYKETLTQAIFAESDAEAAKVIDNFKQQLTAAGVEKFETFVGDIYAKDPKAVNFY